jgi:hypothetical protein
MTHFEAVCCSLMNKCQKKENVYSPTRSRLERFLFSRLDFSKKLRLSQNGSYYFPFFTNR